jgi:hypothetical protein
MNQALKQNTLHQQLLQHMIEQQDLDIYDLMLANEQVNKLKEVKRHSFGRSFRK